MSDTKPQEMTNEQKLKSRQQSIEMEKLKQQKTQSLSLVQANTGAISMRPTNFTEMSTFVDRMAQAGPAVGLACRNNPGVCEAVAMMAFGWGMNPYSVSQKTYVTTDKGGNERIAYEAQLIAAVINQRAPLERRTKIAYKGEGQSLQCVLTVYPIGEEPFEYESPKVMQIKVKNSPLWQAHPRQQLGYFTQRAMARQHFPEIILGVYSAEEVQQMNEGPKAQASVKDQILGLNNEDEGLVLVVEEEAEEPEAEVIIEDSSPEATTESDEDETVEDAVIVEESSEELSQEPEEAIESDDNEVDADQRADEVEVTSDMREWTQYLAETNDHDIITTLFLEEHMIPWRQELSNEQAAWMTTKTNERIKELKDA